MNASHLIERNTKAHTVDGYTAAHMVVDAHERTIRALVADLNLLRGVGATPQAGCSITSKCLGDAEVLVEYEIDEGQRGQLYGPPEDCCEEIAPSAAIIHVFINGHWCDAQDCVPEAVIERWETELLEVAGDADQDYPDRDDSADDYAADRAADRYQQQIERAYP